MGTTARRRRGAPPPPPNPRSGRRRHGSSRGVRGRCGLRPPSRGSSVVPLLQGTSATFLRGLTARRCRRRLPRRARPRLPVRPRGQGDDVIRAASSQMAEGGGPSARRCTCCTSSRRMGAPRMRRTSRVRSGRQATLQVFQQQAAHASLVHILSPTYPRRSPPLARPPRTVISRRSPSRARPRAPGTPANPRVACWEVVLPMVGTGSGVSFSLPPLTREVASRLWVSSVASDRDPSSTCQLTSGGRVSPGALGTNHRVFTARRAARP